MHGTANGDSRRNILKIRSEFVQSECDLTRTPRDSPSRGRPLRIPGALPEALRSSPQRPAMRRSRRAGRSPRRGPAARRCVGEAPIASRGCAGTRPLRSSEETARGVIEDAAKRLALLYRQRAAGAPSRLDLFAVQQDVAPEPRGVAPRQALRLHPSAKQPSQPATLVPSKTSASFSSILGTLSRGAVGTERRGPVQSRPFAGPVCEYGCAGADAPAVAGDTTVACRRRATIWLGKNARGGLGAPRHHGSTSPGPCRARHGHIGSCDHA